MLNVSSRTYGCLSPQIILNLDYLGVSPDDLLGLQKYAMDEFYQGLLSPFESKFILNIDDHT